METALLVVIVVLGAALVIVSALMLNVMRSLRANIGKLEKQVQNLQQEISRQQQNLDAVRAVLDRKPEDPFLHVLQAIERYRSRGFVPAITLVGVRLFKSYLNGKARRKTLPALDKRAE